MAQAKPTAGGREADHPFDLIVRGGLIIDGSGREPFAGDVGIRNGTIVAIGDLEAASGPELNADGCVVTPGFVDIHTHYDGQALWSNRLDPSSSHGVTTVVLGNCGVGFAPCRADDRNLLVNTMEGVEDIPEVVMTEGLDWRWETFEQFLDALDARPHDIDVAAYLPHSALRIFVMGRRGADRQVALPEDLEQMHRLIVRALDHGAVGFSSSRFSLHRRGDGEKIPSFEVEERELATAASAIAVSGHGVLQIIPDSVQEEADARAEVAMFARLSDVAGTPVTFTLLQNNRFPHRWRDVLDWVDEHNRDGIRRLAPQIFPRPLGMLMGHELSLNPFSHCPTYRSLVRIQLPDRISRLRELAVRQALLTEAPDEPDNPLVRFSRNFEHIYPLGTPPEYEPNADANIMARAATAGVDPLALAYDLLLEEGGRAVLMLAAANFATGTLDHVSSLIAHPDTVIALGDGGAHYGFICDSSYPTTVLTHWLQTRSRGRLDIVQAIGALTSEPAALLGFADRGHVAVGLKADLNVIDLDQLSLGTPRVQYDLPSGGRRLVQTATGYRATIVSGEMIMREGRPTGALPGRLVRAFRAGPSPIDIHETAAETGVIQRT